MNHKNNRTIKQKLVDFLRDERLHFIKSRLGGIQLESAYIDFKMSLADQFPPNYCEQAKHIGLKYFFSGLNVIQTFSSNIEFTNRAMRSNKLDRTQGYINNLKDAKVIATVNNVQYLYYVASSNDSDYYKPTLQNHGLVARHIKIRRATANDVILMLGHLINSFSVQDSKDEVNKKKHLDLLCRGANNTLKEIEREHSKEIKQGNNALVPPSMELEKDLIEDAEWISYIILDMRPADEVKNIVWGIGSIDDDDVTASELKQIFQRVRSKYHVPYYKNNSVKDATDRRERLLNVQNWTPEDVKQIGHFGKFVLYNNWKQQGEPKIKNKDVAKILSNYIKGIKNNKK